MADAYRAVIPYESLDPLTIGASGDDEKVYPDTLELEIPQANLARRRSTRTSPTRWPTRPLRREPRSSHPSPGRASPSVLAGKRRACVIIDNQFRPTPPSKLLPPVFDAIEAAGIRRGRRLRERQGLPDVGVRHRAEDRHVRTSTRMERLGIAFFQNDPRNADDVRLTSASPRAAHPCGCTRRSRGAT